MKNNYNFSSKAPQLIDQKNFKDRLVRSFRNCTGALFLSTIPIVLNAQTNPVPQNIPYNQNFDLIFDGSATSFPIGWSGWRLDGQMNSSYSGNASADVAVIPGNNNTTSPGLFDMTGKLGFLSTTGQRTAPILSINGTDRKFITVKYKLNVQRVNSNRGLGVKLQYRVGNTGNFVDVDSSLFEYYGAGTNTNIGTGVLAIESRDIQVDLPQETWYKPEIQLRWVVARTVNNQGTGENHSFSIDDIEVDGLVPEDIPVPFPFTDNFDRNNWTFINGEQLNKFIIDTPANENNIEYEDGKLFISNSNGAPFSASYATNSITNAYAYKNITLPPDITTAKVAFKWMANGESSFDYGRFYIFPESEDLPTTATLINATTNISNAIYQGKIGTSYLFNNFSNAGSFNNNAKIFRDNTVDLRQYAGQTVRVIFYWRNDGSIGTNPSLVIDDFEFTYSPTCLEPNTLTTTAIEGRAATLNWITPPTQSPNTYEYVISTSNSAPTTNTTGTVVTSNSANVTGLNPSTTYYWWVRSVCSDTDKSDWTESATFTTGVSCVVPTQLTNSNVSNTSATINWTSNASNFKYYLSTSNVAPTATTEGTLVNASNANLTNLDPQTTYYWWVKAVCDTNDESLWSSAHSFTTRQATLSSFPINDNFDTNNWTIIHNTPNESAFTKFFVGTPSTANNITYANNKLFISNNGNTANYNNDGITYAFKDVTIPAGLTNARVAFKWILKGESTYDYGRFLIVPLNENLTLTTALGTNITALNNYYTFNNNPFQTSTVNKVLINNPEVTTTTYTGAFENIAHHFEDNSIDVSTYAGQTVRVLFYFRSDISTIGEPSLVIDDFYFGEIPNCTPPTDLTSSEITSRTANVTFTAPTNAANTYEYYISTNQNVPTATTEATGSTNNLTINLTQLVPYTNYNIWVRSACSTTEKSEWTTKFTFRTLQEATTYPYIDNFDTEQWVYINGTQTNKFYTGTPITANNVTYADNKLFVSNDGLTNTYASTASSVYAYRDITLPATITNAQISFDWILKGEGISATTTPYDYARFYIIPASITPTAGTNLGFETITDAIYTIQDHNVATGRRTNLLYNPGTTYNGAFENIAHHYVDNNVNLAAYAGQTVRLVFFFRNDTSVYPPSLAIDNFSIKDAPNCVAPTNVTATTITNQSATINWTASVSEPANGYEYYLSTTNIAPTENTEITGSTATNSLDLTNLTANTNHFIWIRSTCSTTEKSEWTRAYSFTTEIAPIQFPFIDDFSTLKWKLVSNSINKFKVGIPTGTTITFNSDALFVSNNNTDYAYTLADSNKSNSYAYTDVVLPNDITNAKIKFDWLAKGESSYDFGRFFIVPTSYRIDPSIDFTSTTTIANKIYEFGNNPHKSTNKNLINRLYQTALPETTANAWIPTGTFEENKTTYVDELIDLSAYAGQTVRLVFIWRNDTSGGAQPPLAIDNFRFEATDACIDPFNLRISMINSNSATINWIGNSTEYTYAYSTTNALPSATFTTTSNEATITDLQPNTTYYWWVKSNCNTSNEAWVNLTFTTTKLSQSYPLTDNFNENDKWNIVNGTQPNKFIIGTPTNTALTFENNTLFISNNNTTNEYDIENESSVFSFVDVQLPNDITTAEIAFDWYAKGENNYDFGRFFITTTNYIPTAGTEISTTAAIANQIFSSAQLSVSSGTGTSFETAKSTFRNNQLDLASYAGQTVRLVFAWNNDDSVGTQTPLAIDNLYFGSVRNLATNNLAENKFEFYPNPIQNELNFRGNQTISSIQVYNLAGQVIDHAKVGEKTHQLNTTKLTAGVYIVKVTFENGTTKTIKIIKK